MKQKHLIYIAIGGIVLLIAAFYGGARYEASSALAARRSNLSFSGAGMMGGQGGQFMRRNGQGGGFGGGNIISMDSKSITLQLPGGGSQIVFYSTSTEVGKFVAGSVSDLAVGKSVTVTGASNPDGSLAASSIQIRPEFATSTQR